MTTTILFTYYDQTHVSNETLLLFKKDIFPTMFVLLLVLYVVQST